MTAYSNQTKIKMFTDSICEHHAAALHENETLRDAVIIKMIALLTLAYDIPPTSDDETWNLDEVLAKLKRAIEVLRTESKTGAIQ